MTPNNERNLNYETCSFPFLLKTSFADEKPIDSKQTEDWSRCSIPPRSVSV